jgi:ATP synthase F1 gamma subunit
MRLKQELRLSEDLGDIIDVLKSAALIQFRLFQFKDKPSSDFLKELEACFKILPRRSVIDHPYFIDRPELPTAIVVITSDEGFLGELNTLLINACLDRRGPENDEIIVLGERGARYFNEAKEKFVAFHGITDEVSLKEVENLRNYLLKSYYHRFGRILIFYPEFLSLTAQRVTFFQLLPYLGLAEQVAKVSQEEEDILTEPGLNRVLDALVKLWLESKLFHIFWSTKLSEFSARIMHLEGSTQELSHLNHRLAFDYFRNVHALNDKTIREISASKVLLGKNS